MSSTESEVVTVERVGGDRKQGWIAAGGVIGAVLASSCCVVPLLLLTLGVSGAWIGNFTALEPFKPWFLAVALAFIALGFRQVYFEVKPACVAGAYCAKPERIVVTKAALWIATLLVVLSASIDWWAPYFY